jgi:hypothetical protein
MAEKPDSRHGRGPGGWWDLENSYVRQNHSHNKPRESWSLGPRIQCPPVSNDDIRVAPGEGFGHLSPQRFFSPNAALIHCIPCASLMGGLFRWIFLIRGRFRPSLLPLIRHCSFSTFPESPPLSSIELCWHIYQFMEKCQFFEEASARTQNSFRLNGPTFCGFDLICRKFTMT